MTHKQTYLLNGSTEQTISPFDRGLTYGDGVFRTLKVNHGRPCHWALHYQKLVADCTRLGIVCPASDLLISDIAALFTEDNLAVAKIVITRGESERGYAIPAISTPTRLVIKSKLPYYEDAWYADGVTLHVCETRLSAQPKLAGIKHLNRLENVLARSEWQDDMLFDGLLLDAHDHAIECTMSNLFARYGDELITPELSSCGVAGVTRQRIMDMAKSFNLNAKEKPITFAHLLHADEVLICNTLYGAFQVTRIQQKTWIPSPLAYQIRSLLAHD
jgi:4-amino-4-deoxychorismate lyase